MITHTVCRSTSTDHQSEGGRGFHSGGKDDRSRPRESPLNEDVLHKRARVKVVWLSGTSLTVTSLVHPWCLPLLDVPLSLLMRGKIQLGRNRELILKNDATGIATKGRTTTDRGSRPALLLGSSFLGRYF